MVRRKKHVNHSVDTRRGMTGSFNEKVDGFVCRAFGEDPETVRMSFNEKIKKGETIKNIDLFIVVLHLFHSKELKRKYGQKIYQAYKVHIELWENERFQEMFMSDYITEVPDSVASTRDGVVTTAFILGEPYIAKLKETMGGDWHPYEDEYFMEGLHGA